MGLNLINTLVLLKNEFMKKWNCLLHILLDEEIGGIEGMKKFVTTKDFKSLNVGFALDEGIASPSEEYALNFGERCIWRKKTDKIFSLKREAIFVCLINFRFAHSLSGSTWSRFALAKQHGRRKGLLYSK